MHICTVALSFQTSPDQCFCEDCVWHESRLIPPPQRIQMPLWFRELCQNQAGGSLQLLHGQHLMEPSMRPFFNVTFGDFTQQQRDMWLYHGMLLLGRAPLFKAQAGNRPWKLMSQ